MRRFFGILFFVGSFASGFAVCLKAETASYPETNPAFSVTVPQGWEVKHEHGAVKIVAQADAIFVLQYVQNVKDENTATAALPELAALQGKQFSLEDVKVETSAATTLMGDYKGFITECSGKSRHGTETSWQVMIFSPKADDYYLITCLWSKDDAEKTSADRLALFKSLKAIR